VEAVSQPPPLPFPATPLRLKCNGLFGKESSIYSNKSLKSDGWLAFFIRPFWTAHALKNVSVARFYTLSYVRQRLNLILYNWNSWYYSYWTKIERLTLY